MGDDFCMIPKELPLSSTLHPVALRMRKIQMINDICAGTEKSYLTDMPNVVKLCRKCIQLICTKLTMLMNEEAFIYKGYKEYKEVLSKATQGIEPEYSQYIRDSQITTMLKRSAVAYGYASSMEPIPDISQLQLELDINMTNSKHNYAKYKEIYDNLLQSRVCTAACVRCAENTDYIP